MPLLERIFRGDLSLDCITILTRKAADDLLLPPTALFRGSSEIDFMLARGGKESAILWLKKCLKYVGVAPETAPGCITAYACVLCSRKTFGCLESHCMYYDSSSPTYCFNSVQRMAAFVSAAWNTPSCRAVRCPVTQHSVKT